MGLDQLDGRQHFAVPRRLQKPDVFGVRVEDVHGVEVDPLSRELPAEVARDDEIGDDGDRTAIAEKEHPAEMRIEIRFHDQVGRLAVRQPHAAHRRHRRADHHRLKNRLLRRGGEHQDDDKRPDRQPDHRHAVENARRECDDRGHRNNRGQDRAAVAPKQKEGHPFEHAGLRDDGDEKRQAEDEEHRVGMNQVVQPVERQHVLAASTPTTRVSAI